MSGRDLPRKLVVLAAMVVPLVTSGCFLLPGDPLPGGYVVNRDGHYYAGVRCSLGVMGAQANWSDQLARSMEPSEYPPAFWKVAVDPPGVREILLFEEGQPGVRTVISGVPRAGDGPIQILMLVRYPSYEYQRSAGLSSLGSLLPGQVDSVPGVMSWEDFAAMSDHDFGC